MGVLTHIAHKEAHNRKHANRKAGGAKRGCCAHKPLGHMLSGRVAKCRYGCCGLCFGCHMCYMRQRAAGIAVGVINAISGLIALIVGTAVIPYERFYNCALAPDVTKTCEMVNGEPGVVTTGSWVTLFLSVTLFSASISVSHLFGVNADAVADDVSAKLLQHKLPLDMHPHIPGIVQAHDYLMRSVDISAALYWSGLGFFGAHAFYMREKRMGIALALLQIVGLALTAVIGHYRVGDTHNVPLAIAFVVSALIFGLGFTMSSIVQANASHEIGAYNTRVLEQRVFKGAPIARHSLVELAQLIDGFGDPVLPKSRAPEPETGRRGSARRAAAV